MKAQVLANRHRTDEQFFLLNETGHSGDIALHLPAVDPHVIGDLQFAWPTMGENVHQGGFSCTTRRAKRRLACILRALVRRLPSTHDRTHLSRIDHTTDTFQ